MTTANGEDVSYYETADTTKEERRRRMREIIFRGMKKTGEWEYGSLIDMDGQTDQVYISERFPYASSFTNQQLTAMNMRRVDRETIGQYTGLKDRNGKMIFEGDIVECHAIETTKVVIVEDIRKIPVQFKWVDIYNGATIKVIGNIHDQKEDV